MRYRLHAANDIFRYELLGLTEPDALDEEEESVPPFADHESARRFLDRFTNDQASLRHMWDFVQDSYFPAFNPRTDKEVLDRIARSLVGGLGTRLVQRRFCPNHIYYIPAVEEALAIVAPIAKTWIKLKVVDDSSGSPISGVVLDFDLPGGQMKTVTTGFDGTAEVKDITKGSCSASCGFSRGARIEHTLVFLKIGESPTRDAESDANESKPAASGTRIVIVEEHKGKTGETIAGIAADAGLTLKALAEFNWGSSDADKIDQALLDIVGCSKRAADGKSPCLDSTDDPGIIYLPKMWKAGDLSTGKQHTIRVRTIIPSRRIRILLRDIAGPDGLTWRGLDREEQSLAWEISVGGITICQGMVDSRGRIKTFIPVNIREAVLRIWPKAQEDDVAGHEEFTLSFIDEIPEASSSAKGLQASLSCLGFHSGAVDGYIGPVSHAALSTFQERYGLNVTDCADEDSIRKFEDLLRELEDEF